MSKMSLRVAVASAMVFAFGVPAYAAEQDVTFDIVRFQIDGNSLLPQTQIDQLVAPFIGRKKLYADVQKALEVLDAEYRRLGFGTVNVYVPEQELTSGVVKMQVTEGVIGKVTITGNKYFNEENIRASLPQLIEGKSPNMRTMSENIQLANESPAKQMEVTLGVSEEEGKVNARVEVAEDDPERYYVTLDNTGVKTTGRHRIGVSYQNANIGNRDQVVTLNYITAIDPPGGVKVDIFSVGYRLPLYSIGDSIDFIYANSSTNTPSTVAGGLGGLDLNGKGEVFAFRYNHMFARQGEYSSKLVAGLDYKFLNSTCTTNGVLMPFGTAGCTPYTIRPVSLTYSGNWQKPGEAIDFNVGIAHHLFPMGVSYPFGTTVDRYTLVTGRPTAEKFTVLRFGGGYSAALPQNLLFRSALSGQYSKNALMSGEQLGLVGSNAVRGFYEREVAMDRGYVANLELYSPDYGTKLGLAGNLKALAFYDFAQGQNIDVPSGSTSLSTNASVASIGLGLRYNFKKDISFKFDIAHVLDGNQSGSAGLVKDRNFLGHFSFAYGF